MASMSEISRSRIVSLSFRNMVAEAATTLAPDPSVGQNATVGSIHVVRFNFALAISVLALVVCFFLVGFAAGMLERCFRSSERNSDDVVNRFQGGLDPEVVKALPIVQYKDLPTNEQVQKYAECPVCLAAFDATDAVRLLPLCSHAFHPECIDAWFTLHSTCPLCRACLAPPVGKTIGAGHVDNHGEQTEINVPEGCDIEVVISGDRTEQERSASSSISGTPQDRTGGPPVANSPTVEEEQGVNADLCLGSNAERSFNPAVAIGSGSALERAASIRRSSSAGTGLHLLRPSYGIDSEGTQHNRNYETHAVDLKELLLKDHREAAHSQQAESSSRRQYWLPADVETGVQVSTTSQSRD